MGALASQTGTRAIISRSEMDATRLLWTQDFRAICRGVEVAAPRRHRLSARSAPGGAGAGFGRFRRGLCKRATRDTAAVSACPGGGRSMRWWVGESAERAALPHGGAGEFGVSVSHFEGHVLEQGSGCVRREVQRPARDVGVAVAPDGPGGQVGLMDGCCEGVELDASPPPACCNASWRRSLTIRRRTMQRLRHFCRRSGRHAATGSAASSISVCEMPPCGVFTRRPPNGGAKRWA